MTKPLLDDDLNRKIIACLQVEGRVSHAELAERLNVSRPTIIDRVKRLENEGIIRGYYAGISPSSVDKASVAYVSVKYRTENEQLEKQFIEALGEEPDILEAYTTAGEDSLLLKIVADTPMGINELLRKIRSLGPQASTRTTIVLETHFEKPGPSPFPSHEMGLRRSSKKK
ncbi:MAG: Lrp/AsnC family transcriptional regulator [Holophagaceae bacterium]|jgi:Lrp/AsnC family leucine-responsive transcriptional regulator|nr:Lrp/AsnC family transcriptional regulator [Holophagaceae bacterium]